ncbi:MAG: hypothetical protein N3C12_02810, partial [Candidatus Binatia bacterium]|nr:hypothetical protein [Candidatus Binatia bacterium]
VGPNGSPAERVLILVGGTAELRPNAKVHGTVFSRGTATVRRYAVLHGVARSAHQPGLADAGAALRHHPPRPLGAVAGGDCPGVVLGGHPRNRQPCSISALPCSPRNSAVSLQAWAR